MSFPLRGLLHRQAYLQYTLSIAVANFSVLMNRLAKAWIQKETKFKVLTGGGDNAVNKKGAVGPALNFFC